MHLLCAEDSVAGIAETRADIGVFIQTAVQMSTVDRNIRMTFMEMFDTFRSCDNAHEFDVFSAVLFNKIHGSDSGTACGQHRVQNENGSLVDRSRKFAEVFMRFVSFFIAIETDMSNLCGGNKGQDASVMPSPARRIGTMASFLPETIGE